MNNEKLLYEMVELLKGMEYGKDLTRKQKQYAQVNGIVVIWGHSDDGMCIDGPVGGGDSFGTEVYFNHKGIVRNECDYYKCPYFLREQRNAKKVKGIFHDDGKPYCWTYETDIPHKKFIVMEDGEPWCEGIVFHASETCGPVGQ